MEPFDPSLIHYWTETRTRGEWPTATVSPACSPSIRRIISVADGVVRTSTTSAPTTGAVCVTCGEIAKQTGGIRATCEDCGFRVVWAPGVGDWTHCTPRLNESHSPVVSSADMVGA